ncbi:MAG: hypothetical protein LBT24_06475 [Tannerella sp.]|jgi:hypothetical protein|nr:hypothetical protein [Tannerella sp.]
MKAIQTFWNITGNPYKAVGNFLTAEYGLQVWALSVHYLRKWYGEVELVTDNSAIPFLEKLNLPYTKVSTELDKLKGKVLPPTFGMAKIYACSLQDEPFTSVDLDVVLFEDVLKNHIEIPLLCQSLETDRRQYPAQKSVYYKPILDLMKRYSAKLPIYMKKPCEKYPCMSIYQCNDLEFNEKY